MTAFVAYDVEDMTIRGVFETVESSPAMKEPAILKAVFTKEAFQKLLHLIGFLSRTDFKLTILT